MIPNALIKAASTFLLTRAAPSGEKAASKTFYNKVVGEGAVAPKHQPGTLETLPDPTARQAPRPKVSGLSTPRRPSVKFFPHDKGLQKGTIPVNPFSGNKVRT